MKKRRRNFKGHKHRESSAFLDLQKKKRHKRFSLPKLQRVSQMRQTSLNQDVCFAARNTLNIKQERQALFCETKNSNWTHKREEEYLNTMTKLNKEKKNKRFRNFHLSKLRKKSCYNDDYQICIHFTSKTHYFSRNPA